MTMKSAYLLASTLGLLAVGAVSHAGPGPITVNTSAVAGLSGFLDFQFSPDTNPGGTPLDSTVTLMGDGLPAPSGITLSNAGAGNEKIISFLFGSSYTFTPTFVAGNTANPDEGSTFQLLLLDGSQNLLPTTNPNGDSVVTITQSAQGTLSAPAVFQPAAPVPEASTMISLGLLLALGWGGLCLKARKKSAAE